MAIYLIYKILYYNLKKFWICFALFSISSLSLGQKTWDGGAGTLSWNSDLNWNPDGIPAAGETILFNTGTNLNIINVQNASIAKLQITNNSNITLRAPTGNSRTLTVTSATNDAILVESGSTLVITGRDAAVDQTLTLTTANTAGLEVNIYGILKVGLHNNVSTAYGIFTKGGSNAVINFNSGGEYKHDIDGGTLPTAVWNGSSTCDVIGTIATVPSGFNQTFGNLGIDCGNLTAATTATMTAAITIMGNLTISGTSADYTMTLDPADQDIRVDGTTKINAFGILKDNNATGANRFDKLLTVNANGLFSNTNNPPYEFRKGITNYGTFNAGTGTFTFKTNDQSLTGTLAIPNVTVTGITLTNEGTLTVATSLSGTGGLTQAVNSTLNIGGTSDITTLSATNSGNTVNYSGATQSAKATTYVNLTLSGSGAKTITGATVNGVLSIEGTATTTGSAPTFGAGSTLQYKGSSSQTTGIEFVTPFTGTGGVIIDNAAGVVQSGSVSINSTLTLTSGSFTVGANTLTLNGPTIAGTPSNLTTSSSSTLVFGGTAAGVLIPTSVLAINDLSMTNTSIVTLQSSLTVSGTISPAGAGLAVGANTLTLNGQIDCGTLAGGASSNITIGGSGTANLSSVTLNNLIINRAVSMCGSVTVGDTLTLTSGSFTVGANTLTLNGPTIAGTPGNLTTSTSSGLSFGGSSSGVMIPSSVADLNNLTINNSNGVTMNSNITIASGGVLTLTSGIVQAGAYILKLTNTNPATALVWTAGSFVNVTSGAFERTLTADLSGAGNNYLFPIGEGNVFKGLNLADVNTGPSGPILRATVSPSGASTVDGTTMSSVDPRYWYLLNINSGNLTSARVELYESGLILTKTVGMAAASGGTYTAIGGSLNPSSITSLPVLNPGPYFSIGTKIYNYFSIQNGNWNATSTWSESSGGSAASTTPVEGDIVFVENGHTITVAADARCSSLTFTGISATLTINSSYTLAVSGTVTLRKQTSASSACSLTGSGSLSCASLAVGSDANPSPTGFSSSTYSHTLTSTVATLNISGNITINSYYRFLAHLRNGVFNLESGILTIGGSLTMNPGLFTTATFSMATGAQSGTLNFTGATPVSLVGTGTNTINLNGTSSLVKYIRADVQTAHATTYKNLTLAGSGVKTVTGVTVNGILSTEVTATVTGTPTYGASSTLQYKGSSSQTTGSEFPATFSGSGGVIIDNLSGVVLSGSVILNSTLSLTNGAFNVGANTLTLQTSDTPIIRAAGTITTTAGSNLSFGSVGNTGGAAFAIPSSTFTAAPEINNLTIYRANSLTLNDQMMSVNGIVLCNGPLATNGNLTLLSKAGGTALIDGSGSGQITGNLTMQRYLPSGFGYKYFSSPFTGATVNEFGDDINLTAPSTLFYKYDENRTSTGWVNYKTGTNTLNPLAGYAVNFGSNPDPNTADITGVVNNGALSITLYNHNYTYTKGFNLAGNPYPSPIDWDAASGWTKTNIDNALYYFSAIDQYTGNYSSYIGGISSDGLATNVIPSMQGFFVHVTNGSYPVTATLGMNNSVRITNKTHAFIKGGETQDKSLIRLTATFSENKNYPDPFVIYYDEKAEVEFDSQLDALKLLNTDLKVPNLYSVTPGGSKLSISALPFTAMEDFIVPLGFKANKAGNVAFETQDVDGFFKDMRIFFFDKLTGIEKELSKGNSYEVSLSVGEYTNRFYLNLYASTTALPENLPVVSDIFNIYSNSGLLKANIGQIQGTEGTLIISNLLGQTLYTRKIYETGLLEFSTGIKDGMYIVTYMSGKIRISRKLLLKKQ